MTQIKDYLHLYFGCEMYVFPPATYSNGWLSRQIERIPDLQWSYILTAKKLQQTIDDEYFPILRPLSDMTEEERDELESYQYDDNIVTLHKYSTVVQNYVPIIFKRMLEMGFDLFGLIESNLAIDKTTLNKQ